MSARLKQTVSKVCPLGLYVATVPQAGSSPERQAALIQAAAAAANEIGVTDWYSIDAAQIKLQSAALRAAVTSLYEVRSLERAADQLRLLFPFIH